MKPINLQITLAAHDTAGLIRALDDARAAVAAGHLNHASCHDVMNTPGAYLLEVNLPPRHPVAYRVPGGLPMAPEDALTHLGAVQEDDLWALGDETFSMEDLLDDLIDEEKLELVLPA